MKLGERIQLINDLFSELSDTNSRLEKQDLVMAFIEQYPDLEYDLAYTLFVLDGYIKSGFTYELPSDTIRKEINQDQTVYDYLSEAFKLKNTQQNTLKEYYSTHYLYRTFLSVVLGRVYKLGFTFASLKALMPYGYHFEPKTVTPMLSKNINNVNIDALVKKYPGDITITEKLDGNRCILYYQDDKWIGQSRNGKLIKGLEKVYKEAEELLDKRYTYDGELLGLDYFKNRDNFNETSGVINSHQSGKDIMYMIFDIVSGYKYSQRREFLDSLAFGEHIKILLPLYVGPYDENIVSDFLYEITDLGGEGVMINFNTYYEQKRTDGLLKVKKSDSMDMRVIDYIDGTGKYEDAIGSLLCEAENDGNIYEARVGTGLSDYDRGVDKDPMEWFENYWLGALVEVEYQQASQNKERVGSNQYSLRHPRFIRFRNDKKETSID